MSLDAQEPNFRSHFFKSGGTRRSRFVLNVVNIDGSFAKTRYCLDAVWVEDIQFPEVFFPGV